MLEYVIGALIGFAFGGTMGVIKYLILWRPYIKSEDKSVSSATVYTKMMVSNVVNVAVLLAVFLARNVLPYDFAIVILFTGIGLALASKLAPMKKILSHLEEA